MFRDILLTIADFRTPVKHFSRKTKIFIFASTIALILSSITEFLPIYIVPHLFTTGGQNSLSIQALLTPFSSVQIFFASLVIGIITRITLIIVLNFTSAAISHEIGKGIMRGILYENYQSSFQKNKDAQLSDVTRKVDSITGGFVAPLFRLLSSTVLLSSALIALIITESYEIIGLIIIIVLSLMIIWAISKPMIRRINNEVKSTIESTLLLANQGINASEEVRLYKLQTYFHQLFAEKDRALRKAQALGQVIGLLPRQMLELIAITGFVFGSTLIYWLTNVDPMTNEMGNTLVIAGLAAYKGMPLITQFYSSITVLASNLAITKDLLGSFKMGAKLTQLSAGVKKKIEFRNVDNLCLKLNQVEFIFPGEKVPLFLPVSLELKQGQRIAIKADSGVGKSTIMRICAGLLKPTAGTCLLVGQKLNQRKPENLALSDFCSFVGQRTFIEDSNIERNVVLSSVGERVNSKRLDYALHLACLDEFSSKGEKGLKYEVGLDGAKLSEGQKQRLALARAFYSDRPIYLFDEVTSGLDRKTTAKLFARSKEHLDKKILLMITHDEWLLDAEFQNKTKMMFRTNTD